MKRTLINAGFVGLGVLIPFALLLCWIGMYPDRSDPKNLAYVLWKHGLNENMDLDNALSIMTHDRWPVRLVEGKSRDELKERFGYIRNPAEARPYDQLCFTLPNTIGERGVRAGKEVVFLRDSDWMVILDHGKAVDLVLCKGY